MDIRNCDVPDPGSVELDDRCDACAAGDGEDCDPDCRCPLCNTRRDTFWEAFTLYQGQGLAGQWVSVQYQQAVFPRAWIDQAAIRSRVEQQEKAS